MYYFQKMALYMFYYSWKVFGVYTNIKDFEECMEFGQLKDYVSIPWEKPIRYQDVTFNINEWKLLKIDESWKRTILYHDGSSSNIEIKKNCTK